MISQKKDMLKKVSALYIEDEPEIRKNMTLVLELFLKEVYSFESAEEGLEAYEKYNPDIIISDIQLPGMSGIDFIKKIREKNELIPIILMSSFSEKKYLLDGIKLKLIDYLIKPTTLEELTNALESAANDVLKYKKDSLTIAQNIDFYFETKTLYFNEEEIKLTAKEVLFLEILIKNRDRITSQEELKCSVWKDEYVSNNALKSLINKIRKKIGKYALVNISSLGYKLKIFSKDS